MSLLDFPDNIIDNIYNNLDQQSRLSLKYSCRFFDIVSNHYLLQNIYFYNETSQRLPIIDSIESYYKLNYTLIPLSKLDSFLEFLKLNKNLLKLINSLYFNSNKLTNSISNFVTFLIQNKAFNIKKIKFALSSTNFLFLLLNNNCLVSTVTSNLNSDSNSNSSIYPSTLLEDNNNNAANKLNSNLIKSPVIIPKKMSKLYENDEIDDDSTFSFYHISTYNKNSLLKLPFNLDTLQLFSIQDVRMIEKHNLIFQNIEMKIQNPELNSMLDTSIIENWSKHLISLISCNIFSSNFLIDGVLNYLRLNNIEINNENMIFKNLNTLSLATSSCYLNKLDIFLNSIDMNNLENLEIKFQNTYASDNSNINITNKKIVKLLNNKLNSNNLKNLSIINLNNHNMLNDNIFRNEFFDDSNLCFSLLNHSNIFNNENNSITNLTICLNTFLTVVEAKMDGVDSYKTFVVNENYLNRKKELFDKILSLKHLQILTIPDFLFNWLPFFQETITFNKDYDIDFADSLSTRSTAIIRKLYSRFKNFENISGLDILNRPIFFEGKDIYMNLYLDKLVPIMILISEKLPHLQLLNLGGALVSIHRSTTSPTTVEKLVGVYDPWVFTNYPNWN
jgi:hypothetical protein